MPNEPTLTRRTLLRTATAGGATLLATNGLPAWARPVVAATHLRHPDSRPFPHLPAGHASMPEIKHIVVLIMENHSFDNLLGMVPHQLPGRAGVDGLKRRHGKITNFNRDAHGHKIFAQHASSPCQLHAVPSQSWDASHESYNGGHNNGFVRASTAIAMRFWDQRDLPVTYSIARHYPIGQRFFCSVLAQTYPNRRFFFAGTASGSIDDKAYALTAPAANGTIFDRLDAHHINWRVYAEGLQSPLILPNFRNNPAQMGRLTKMDQFYTDVAAGKLPAFTFIDPDYNTTSEENPQDIQVGEQFVSKVVHALTHAPTWKNTALFITYDEHGGYYDHVPPPKAIKPDNIRPQTYPGENAHGGYDRYGFRVPLMVVSPWARKNYVSSRVQDLTSITAFIERKWNLPALTYRDANAEPMTDYFDLGHKPAFLKPPRLAHPPALAPGLAKCHAQGLNPPLPSGGAADASEVARGLASVSR